MKYTYLGIALIVLFSLGGCAQLHGYQIGNIDRNEGSMKTFEVKVSGTGVNLEEANQVAQGMFKLAGNKKGAEGANSIKETVAMFQFGPKTGNPVYDEKYADKLYSLVRQKCQSGHVSGLTIVRETRKYPVISGEIVKITGFCQQ